MVERKYTIRMDSGATHVLDWSEKHFDEDLIKKNIRDGLNGCLEILGDDKRERVFISVSKIESVVVEKREV